MDVDLLFDPLAPPRYCPQCARVGIKTTVKKFKVNPCSADLVIMCKNEKCPWPFSVRSPTEATVRLELPVLKQLGLHEISKSKKDPAWLKSMPLNAGPVVLLQGDNPDCQLSLPVLLLVAISPLVRNILSADHLPPSFSTPVISIPSLSVDILESVGKMLVSGTASMDMSRLCRVRDVFKMMGIEDRMMIYKDSVHTVGNDEVHGDMDVEHLHLSLESLTDDQTNTNNEDINGNVFVDKINDVLKNLLSIKSEACVQDDPENENIEIVVKLEVELKVEDPVFMLHNDEQSRQFDEKDINLTSLEESLTTIETIAKQCIPRLKHADSPDEGFDKLSVEEDTRGKLFKQPSSHTSLKNKCLRKKISCPQCNLMVDGQRHLNRHLRTVHNKETVQCPYCDMTLGYRSLKKHISYIHKQNPLPKKKCPHCEKIMIAGNLSKHIRIVHNKESTQCPHCDQTPGYSNLKRHIFNVHGQNKQTCPHCEKKITGGYLPTHIRRVHNKESAQCDKMIAGCGLYKHIRQELIKKLEADPCSDSRTKKKKKKKNKCKDTEKENESAELLNNLETEEETSANDSTSKKKKREKNSKCEAVDEAEHIWAETGLVSTEDSVKTKKKKESRDTDRQVDNILVENNFSPEIIQKRPSSNKDRTFIKDIYFAPDPAIITGQLYKVVMYILDENITVSKLNAVYTANCFPGIKKTREYLIEKHNANIRFFTEEEDMKIRIRFKYLVDMKIVTNPKEFIKQLNEQNGKEKDFHRKKDKATRNIVGLYLGQDLDNRIAHIICQRLIYLLTGVSLENIHSKYAEIKKHKESMEGTVYKVKQKARGWTLDEDKVLVKMVLKHRDDNGCMKVEQCVEKNVDWDPIAEYFKEFGRTRQLVRERWNRSVKMMLLEDVQDPETMYEYQRSLLEHVRKMGVKDRREIRWKEVASDFSPKTSAVLSQDFWNLIRHKKNETLSDKMDAALECLEKPFAYSVTKKVKKNETQSQLYDFYLSLSPQ